MTEGRVNSVRSVEIGVSDLARSIGFYRDVWGLEPVRQTNDACYFRATGPEHHVLVLHRAPKIGLIRINLGAADAASVDALHRRVQDKGGVALTRPAPVGDPGGGYGFSFRDGEGRAWRILSDVARHAESVAQPDRVTKLSHVVCNTADVGRAAAFLCEAAGFRLSDQTGPMSFLRCNADHHSVAFAAEGTVTINHTAWEMPSFDGLMYGAGRLKEHGYAIEWGLGRHGPGANIFAYFVDPDGYAVEYTTDIQQIDEDTYTPGTAADWQSAKIKRPDRWGLAGLPSERVRLAMQGAGQTA
jgi:catechol 2,3-dioxygenase